MDKSTVETDAARRLIAALDRYTERFDAMVRAHMDMALYQEVSACLVEIREAKAILFSQLASQSVDFVVAHTSLMTSLWNVQLARSRGDAAPFLETQAGALRTEHDEAVEKVLHSWRVPPAPRPSSSPGTGQH